MITGESEKYMQSLALEVGDMMKQIMAASPLITREAAALTVALSCCDDAHKFSERAGALKERMEELEVAAELWQEEKVELLKSAVDTQKDAQMAEKLARLESENSILEESLQRMKALEARAAGLEEENNALRQAAGDAAANEQAQLAAENDELRRRLQEANESARKREEALQATQQALTENQANRAGAGGCPGNRCPPAPARAGPGPGGKAPAQAEPPESPAVPGGNGTGGLGELF